MMTRYKTLALAIATICLTGTVHAERPDLQTTGRVIFLADNLDEAQNLGWCIDTLGRGFSERLQAHSCKPRGGDVQFGFDAESLQIQSIEFEGKCMTLRDLSDQAIPFALLDCDPNSAEQQFEFDTGTGEISLASRPGTCVVVAEASRQAGPFMSRDLTTAACDRVDPAFKSWVQQN